MMTDITRRQFLRQAAAGGLLMTASPVLATDTNPCGPAHPLVPPDSRFSGRCPNCGMPRRKWARTWKTFTLDGRPLQTCSFHCLADISVSAERQPDKVKTALYLAPGTMVPADSAWYVVGSAARGTMTRVSKAAFAHRPAARRFADRCGGRLADYQQAMAAATAAVPDENRMIDRRRIKMGKIVVPADGRDECAVCGMYPARYPAHRCQIHTGRNILHFCSTHCLFGFLSGKQIETDRRAGIGMAWVTDHARRGWISSQTAFYVVGADRNGPMGKEAFAFKRRADAATFSRRHGGRVTRLGQLLKRHWP